jgi:hypothetical protein
MRTTLCAIQAQSTTIVLVGPHRTDSVKPKRESKAVTEIFLRASPYFPYSTLVERGERARVSLALAGHPHQPSDATASLLFRGGSQRKAAPQRELASAALHQNR